MSYPKVHEVNDENRDAGNPRYEKLVAPANIEEIIADPEYRDGLQREDGGEV